MLPRPYRRDEDGFERADVRHYPGNLWNRTKPGDDGALLRMEANTLLLKKASIADRVVRLTCCGALEQDDLRTLMLDDSLTQSGLLLRQNVRQGWCTSSKCWACMPGFLQDFPQSLPNWATSTPIRSARPGNRYPVSSSNSLDGSLVVFFSTNASI